MQILSIQLCRKLVSDQALWDTVNDAVAQNAGRRLRVLIDSQSMDHQCHSLETPKGWQKVAWSIHVRGHLCRSLGRGLPLTLPLPQTSISILMSCPFSKLWFAVETQLKQKIFLNHSLFIPYSCRHCQI